MMLSEGPVALKTLTDADAVPLASLANNKKVWGNVRDSFPHPYGIDDARSFIALGKNESPAMTFGIFYLEALCGVAGLVSQQDVYRMGAEIGYWLGEPCWNKGIASQAVKILTAYGFGQLNLKRIQAGVFEYNKASMKVLEKNGYRQEGIFFKSVYKNGKYWNEHRYAIIS